MRMIMAPLLLFLTVGSSAAAGESFLIGDNPGSEPAVAVLSDSMVVVVYESGGKVVFSIPGVVSESPVAPPGPEPEVSPDVAALPGSGFVAVWLAGLGEDVRPQARLFDGDGVPTSGVIEVGGQGHAVDISVDALPAGGFVVSWAELWPPVLDDVFVRIHGVSGQPTGSALQANEPGVIRNIHPQVATAPDGSFTVVWGTNDTEVSTCLARRHTGEGGSWDDIQPVAADGAFPDIAVAADGSNLMAWAATLGKRSVLSLRQGETTLILGGSNVGTVVVAMQPAGPAVVAWHEGVLGGSGLLRARILDDSGQPAGEIFTVAEDATSAGAPPGVAISADGRIIFAWTDHATGRILGCWRAEPIVPAAAPSWGSLKSLWR